MSNFSCRWHLRRKSTTLVPLGERGVGERMVHLLRILACCACAFLAPSWIFAAVADPIPDQELSSGIAAAPLPHALSAFAQQTGLQLIYVSQLAEGRRSQAVPAGLPPAVALARMLAGTGLDFEFIDGRTIKIFAAPPASLPGHEAPARSASNRSETLEEIVVTATKREELLSAVAISANVLSAQDMDAFGVKGIADIAAMTPDVEYDYSTQWGPGILTNLAIRGINSDVGTSTTGVYVDDVPVQARNANFGNPYPLTFDLTRVELLRGPQGTLFGAGAEGGAVRYITSDPSLSTFSGLSHTEVAQTQNGGVSYEAGAAAGGPIVDGLLGVRLSAWYRDDGGYVTRIDPLTDAVAEKDANHSSSRALRLALAFAPSDTFRISPSVIYQSVDIHDTPNFYEYLSNPDAGLLQNGKLLRQPATDSFALASVKLEQKFGGVELSAVTAYFNRSATASIDTTNEAGIYYFGGYGNPLGPGYPTSDADAVPTLLTLHQTLLSQEVQLTSADTASPIRWVTGLFVSRSRQDDTRDTYGIQGPADPGLYYDDDTTDTLLAGFANFDITLAPRWTLSLGARADHTRSDFTGYDAGFAYPSLPALTRGVTEETPLTPRFSLAYASAGGLFVYATLAKGFRIGGVNVDIPPQCSNTAIPATYASDSVWSHEIGAKDSLLDGRLGIDTSIYEVDWSRIQVPVVFDCGFGYTGNAGAAKSAGFDLAIRAQLTERLGFELAVGLVEVHYTETVLNSAGEVIVGRGTVVGGVPSVPSPWSGLAGAHYRWSISGDLNGYARAQDIVHSHNPGPFTELEPKAIGYDPRFVGDPAINQLNVQFGLLWKGLDLKLFLNNALDTQPLLQRSADAPESTLVYAYTIRPRTFGLASSWNF
jgi:iron complex outermembrane recepter protein